jgi:hypothetical protein
VLKLTLCMIICCEICKDDLHPTSHIHILTHIHTRRMSWNDSCKMILFHITTVCVKMLVRAV